MRGYANETITAISTAPGSAGIGIVRASGPAAVATVDRIFRAKSGRPLAEAASHTVHYGHIVRDGEVLDEVLVSLMRAPRSYTREDVVEISCHGGTQALSAVLEAVLASGARLARPGEFTERAFLSGRIDLSEAEAVMDLIDSSNRAAARAALSQLGGALRRRVEALRASLLHETARVEAALDDPEHYDVDSFRPEIEKALAEAREDLAALLASAREGRVVRDGVNTVILGRPNVGKSTLLNLLSGAERAIVTELPGTTRDVLEEHVLLGGVPLNLRDTAGLRESEDRIEQIGVARAHAAADEAELIFYVLDASQIRSAQDAAQLAALSEAACVVLIRNKCDLAQQLSREEAQALKPGAPVVDMAACDGHGLRTLAELVRERFFAGALAGSGEVLVTNLRHQEALREAAEALDAALQTLRKGLPEDLLAADLLAAYGALGRIIGEGVGEDLIDEIFSNFCLGK